MSQMQKGEDQADLYWRMELGDAAPSFSTLYPSLDLPAVQSDLVITALGAQT